MKKTFPLVLIICLLTSSCQLSGPRRTDSGNPRAPDSQTDLIEYSDFENVFEPVESSDWSFYPASRLFSSSAPSKSKNASVPSRLPSTGFVSSPSGTDFALRPSPAAPFSTAVLKTALKTTTAAPTAPSGVSQNGEKEIRGVWISCYDHICAAGKTREEYKAETDKTFKTIADAGLNLAFVHLRAFSDAFYKSDLYPYSRFIAGTEGASLPFDPFEVILESAAKRGISTHGWINPFRISFDNDPSSLSDANPAKKILDAGNAEGEIVVLENGIYYNPSLVSNHRRIFEGVAEILNKYDLDGIHIDDYFYPSTDVSVDKKQYDEYKKNGGALGLADWRRSCADAFVSGFYSAVKAVNPKLIVSVSLSAQIEKNTTKLYADCRRWLSKEGYADVIIPQLYFGFEHEKSDFNSLLNEWASLPRNPKVSLACGLAAYKCAKPDPLAGKGASEWLDNSDVLARQLKATRKRPDYKGFVLFSYKDILRENCQTEIQNFKKAVRSDGK